MWGCLAKIGLPDSKKRKLGQKTNDCIFIGYADNNAIYKFLVLRIEKNILEPNTIIESKDAEFFENIFPMKNRTPNNQIKEAIQADKTIEEENELEPRRSKRVRKTTDLGDDFVTSIGAQITFI